jgi:Asp-tRNA(Asn)/Glu-tRNA(Gln) amidotransferase A subunit family amidase
MEVTIPELQTALPAGPVTSRDLVTMYLARIDAYDQKGPALNAISAVNSGALAEADALDAERKNRRVRGPLHGIPVIVKDNYETVTMQTRRRLAPRRRGWSPTDAFSSGSSATRE